MERREHGYNGMGLGAHLRLHLLPLLQVQAVLVGFLVPVELLQLLGQGGRAFAGLLLEAMVFLHLGRGPQHGMGTAAWDGNGIMG